MSQIEREPFGTTKAGRPVERFTLRNAQGQIARLITYGATLTELWIHDRDGALSDVVLGFDKLEPYETISPYFGCTTGRVANRIAHGKFTLNRTTYQLATNNAPHHLHGGVLGLDNVVWSAEPVVREDGAAVRLRYRSPAGEEGYPGNLSIEVVYVLTHAGELRIEYTATTDAPTPVNLTHHSYFNLAGHGSGTILDHVLQIFASRYTKGDETLIPTGEIAPVFGTPLDFTEPAVIGARIADVPGGYDLNYVLDGPDAAGARLHRACVLRDRKTGRRMEILTDEPGLQFYSGNFLDNVPGKGGAVYPRHGGLCLETQHFPDSVNQPVFPSIILNPGDTYRQIVVHRFSAE